MPKLASHPNGAIAIFDGPTYRIFTDMGDVVAAEALWGPRVALDADQFTRNVATTQVLRAYMWAGAPGGSGSTVDPAAIALKVEQQLADDFARLEKEIAEVNANINDQPTSFKVTPA